MGRNCRTAAAAPIFRFLGNGGQNMGAFPDSYQKNFEKYENFICTFKKIGYNKVE